MSRWSVDIPPKIRAAFLQTHPVCWMCGHPGADQIDHAIAVSLAPWLAMEPSNFRAAHGVNGCPLCPPRVSADKRRNGQPRRCNQERGDRPGIPQQRTSRRW